MMTDKNKESLRLCIWSFGIFVTIFTAAMVIGAQNEKLNATIEEQSIMRKTVQENSMAVRELKTDISYIRQGVDEIRKEVRK